MGERFQLKKESNEQLLNWKIVKQIVDAFCVYKFEGRRQEPFDLCRLI